MKIEKLERFDWNASILLAMSAKREQAVKILVSSNAGRFRVEATLNASRMLAFRSNYLLDFAKSEAIRVGSFAIVPTYFQPEILWRFG
ncbi:MAG: hypothetical protein LH472_07060 [Pyrinomonadaceae bacterium]|nr:hypothetical protein [Pyrinomonadaceae bacterium]